MKLFEGTTPNRRGLKIQRWLRALFKPREVTIDAPEPLASWGVTYLRKHLSKVSVGPIRSNLTLTVGVEL